MEDVRALSKTLFGGSYRLEVACAVLSGDLISLTSFYQELRNPPSLSCVAKELKTLESAGLIVRQPSLSGMREVFYIAVESPFWETCRHIMATSRTHAGASIQGKL